MTGRESLTRLVNNVGRKLDCGSDQPGTSGLSAPPLRQEWTCHRTLDYGGDHSILDNGANHLSSSTVELNVYLEIITGQDTRI